MEKKEKKKVSITLSEDAYWKLQELKVMHKCKTWEELIEKLHKLFKEKGECRGM